LFAIVLGVALVPISISGWGVRELAVVTCLGGTVLLPSRHYCFPCALGLWSRSAHCPRTRLRPVELLVGSPRLSSRRQKGEKGIGNGLWLLLRDPMTGILDVDSPDVACDVSEVIIDDRSKAAGAADTEHRHGQLALGKLSVGYQSCGDALACCHAMAQSRRFGFASDGELSEGRSALDAGGNECAEHAHDKNLFRFPKLAEGASRFRSVLARLFLLGSVFAQVSSLQRYSLLQRYLLGPASQRVVTPR
jgi:hypothetical protein